MTWLTINQAATLLGVTNRAVRKKLSAYQSRTIHSKGGNGGKVFQIALESLPQEVQDRYNEANEQQNSCSFTDYLSTYTGEQRKAASVKCEIVKMFQGSGLSGKRFVEEYNSVNDEHISTNQLYDWQKKLNKGGLAALVDTRGTHDKGSSSIPEEAWELFKALYLTHQKRTVAQCYSLVKVEYPDIPSERTFSRRAESEFTELVKIYYRGTKEEFENCMPYHVRDKSQLDSNDRWSSDHHPCDVMVLNKQGKAVSLTLTVIVDVRSTKILSFRFRDAPGDTSVIKMCLRDAMMKFGIPKEFYTDNGKDYKSNELSSNDESGLSLTEVLEIKQIFAQPHHGQSKPVERFFESFENELGKWFKSYRGPSPDKRTDETRMTSDKLAKKSYVPTMDEYIAKATEYINYYNSERKHTGRGMDNQTPDAVYQQNLHCVREVEDKSVLLLLCGRIAVRTVRRNGVSFDGEFYSNDDGALLDYFKQKVIVIRDPENMFEMVVLEKETKKYICRVHRKGVIPFGNITEEAIKSVKRDIKNAKRHAISAGPDRKLSKSELMSLLSKKHLIERDFAEEYNNRQAEIDVDIISNPVVDSVTVAAKDINKVSPSNKAINVTAEVDDTEDFFAAYYTSNKEETG